jgi:hypothetical protein
MIVEDLEHIFRPQIELGETKLCFMLIDDGHKTVERHAANELEGLLPMLDSFTYAGNNVMPRFTKEVSC